jgi:cytochrome c oxidase subunit 3
MIIGMVIMLWMIKKAKRGDFTPEHYPLVENFGLYWHFVDIVWIFLFPLLYLIGAHEGTVH